MRPAEKTGGAATIQQINKSPVRRATVAGSTPTPTPESPVAPPSPVIDPTSKTVRYAQTVNVRLTWELPVQVKNPKGCTIAYRFTTTPADISFGLYFRDANGTESTLVSGLVGHMGRRLVFPFPLYRKDCADPDLVPPP